MSLSILLVQIDCLDFIVVCNRCIAWHLVTVFFSLFILAKICLDCLSCNPGMYKDVHLIIRASILTSLEKLLLERERVFEREEAGVGEIPCQFCRALLW